jgi:phosphinothricin acetyltransferase
MSSSALIRLARAGDAAAIQRIYAPYVRDTPVSFEIEPPSVDEMGALIAGILPHFPYLVCEHAGEVVGYVYASAHRARAAYVWSVDVAVYIDGPYHRVGVGRALYTSLFGLLALQGFYNAYAGITLPNAGSVGLHESLGFTRVGVYESVGYKAGAWYDVGWWQRALQARGDDPAQPLGLEAAKTLPGWDATLAAGLPLLRI